MMTSWGEVAEELKQGRGRVVMTRKEANALSSALRRRGKQQFTRRLPDGRYFVYVLNDNWESWRDDTDGKTSS